MCTVLYVKYVFWMKKDHVCFVFELKIINSDTVFIRDGVTPPFLWWQKSCRKIILFMLM